MDYETRQPLMQHDTTYVSGGRKIYRHTILHVMTPYILFTLRRWINYWVYVASIKESIWYWIVNIYWIGRGGQEAGTGCFTVLSQNFCEETEETNQDNQDS